MMGEGTVKTSEGVVSGSKLAESGTSSMTRVAEEEGMSSDPSMSSMMAVDVVEKVRSSSSWGGLVVP